LHTHKYARMKRGTYLLVLVSVKTNNQNKQQ
jgi:hypothetical protein